MTDEPLPLLSPGERRMVSLYLCFSLSLSLPLFLVCVRVCCARAHAVPLSCAHAHNLPLPSISEELMVSIYLSHARKCSRVHILFFSCSCTCAERVRSFRLPCFLKLAFFRALMFFLFPVLSFSRALCFVRALSRARSLVCALSRLRRFPLLRKKSPIIPQKGITKEPSILGRGGALLCTLSIDCVVFFCLARRALGFCKRESQKSYRFWGACVLSPDGDAFRRNLGLFYKSMGFFVHVAGQVNTDTRYLYTTITQDFR